MFNWLLKRKTAAEPVKAPVVETPEQAAPYRPFIHVSLLPNGRINAVAGLPISERVQDVPEDADNYAVMLHMLQHGDLTGLVQMAVGRDENAGMAKTVLGAMTKWERARAAKEATREDGRHDQRLCVPPLAAFNPHDEGISPNGD